MIEKKIISPSFIVLKKNPAALSTLNEQSIRYCTVF